MRAPVPASRGSLPTLLTVSIRLVHRARSLLDVFRYNLVTVARGPNAALLCCPQGTSPGWVTPARMSETLSKFVR